MLERTPGNGGNIAGISALRGDGEGARAGRLGWAHQAMPQRPPPTPSASPRPRLSPAGARALAVGFGLALLLALELLLPLLPWAPPSRDDWNRTLGVVGIEHYYPHQERYFEEIEVRGGVAMCAPIPDLAPVPDSPDSTDNAMQWQVFPCTKPEGTLRVVVLGGSSAAGWGVAPGSSFASRLEHHLTGRTTQPVQVINAAVCGYTTVQMRFMLPLLAWLEPDLYVLYAGHNDYNFFQLADAAELTPPWKRSARVLGDQLYLWRLLRQAWYWLQPPEKASGSAATASPTPRVQPANPVLGAQPRPVPSVPVLRQQLIRVEQRNREVIEARFADNVRALAAEARRVDAGLLLVAPVSRLQDPPQDSIHWRELDAPDLAAWNEAWAVVRDTSGADGHSEHLLRALRLDDSYAHLRYTAAERAMAMGDLPAAIDHYEAAADHTPPSRCHKAPPRHAALVRAEAERNDAAFLDAWPLFAQAAHSPGLPGDELFIDAVHPNNRGHELLAEHMATRLLEAGLIPRSDQGAGMSPQRR